MNREIKFRVRDNNTKKIVGYEVVINGVWNREYTGESHKISKWNEGSFSKQYIREQFTGLLDKNGKEIYEGDIISDNKTLKTTELGFISCEVIYEKELACFSVVTLSANKKERYIMPIHALELYIIPNKYEVIGNILSNPELLN